MEDLYEPAIVPDTFVTGLSHIEHVGGGCLRFVLYVERAVDGRRCRMVVDRIVMHSEMLPDAIAKALAAVSNEDVTDGVHSMKSH